MHKEQRTKACDGGQAPQIIKLLRAKVSTSTEKPPQTSL